MVTSTVAERRTFIVRLKGEHFRKCSEDKREKRGMRIRMRMRMAEVVVQATKI